MCRYLLHPFLPLLEIRDVALCRGSLFRYHLEWKGRGGSLIPVLSRRYCLGFCVGSMSDLVCRAGRRWFVGCIVLVIVPLDE